ncbi:MAG: indole-3-glycerol phosphate synthase TrpC [Methylococcales bacterium]|nr:indole-3-glycerol phosphate synthase TrpC [Methylococcales bacterium]
MTDSILTTILNRKTEEISVRKKTCSVVQLKEIIVSNQAPRAFNNAIKSRVEKQQSAVIAEIKKASPSKGVFKENFDPATIATSYEKANATCLSVLTDIDFFQGSDAYLKTVKSVCQLPVIRKDFFIDEYQVYEARAIGADCILLIVAALDDAKLLDLYQLAQHLNMDVLIEVHNQQECQRALKLQPELLGINNRNLKTFETSLNVTIDLLNNIPKETVVVTESGIKTKADIKLMHQHQVYAFLVGEAFMRAEVPGQQLSELFEL